MCVCCQNVVGSARFHPDRMPEGTRLVHFATAQIDACRAHTRESILNIAEFLPEKGTQVPPLPSSANFEEIQRKVGFNYEPQGLLWSRMRKVAALPDSIYWDWMHCICASGGIAQLHLNQFLRRVSRVYNMRSVEAFFRAIVFPKGEKGITMHLKKRMSKSPKKGMRAFAAEVLSLVTAVLALCEAKLVPEAKLKKEVKAFVCLARIIGILRCGDAARAKVELLTELIKEHHRRFMELYDLGKPKLHYMLHLPQCLARFLVNLNCFSAERKHKFTNRVGAFAHRHMVKTLTQRTARKWITSLQDPMSVAPFALEGPKPKALGRAELQCLYEHGVARPGVPEAAICKGTRLKTPRGHLSFRDVIAFRDLHGCACRGIAQSFVRMPTAAGAVEFHAIVIRLQHIAGFCYKEPDDAQIIPIHQSNLRTACAWYRRDDGLHVVDLGHCDV